MTPTRRVGAAVEVALVLTLFLYLRERLRSAGFGEWQEPLFGAALVSSCLLFFVLPLVTVAVRGGDPGACGLTVENLRYHWRIASRAIAFVLPVTLLFPVIGMLGSDHREWLGASVLAAGFCVAGLLVASTSRSLANGAPADLAWKDLSVYIALLVLGLAISYVLHPFSRLATRLVQILVFVALLEEFFFRGYVQSRLNDCFGKPLRYRDVELGAGLLLAAVIFGMFHPLTVAGDRPWAWALWTAAVGLIFGFLREKTGAVVAPAMLHVAIWIPGVFFGPA